jgi:hypothetical protein
VKPFTSINGHSAHYVAQREAQGMAMYTIIHRNSHSPEVKAELAALGLVGARTSLGPALLISIVALDIAAALLSLAAQ